MCSKAFGDTKSVCLNASDSRDLRGTYIRRVKNKIGERNDSNVLNELE